MIKIDRAVIVEGKYDKIKLSSILDAIIIETDGFGIFKDKDKQLLIKKFAETRGILILTDSDSAGFKIRSFIKNIAPHGDIVNAYIPDVFGKEKRKTEPSKEGKLGVEGISAETLRNILEKAGSKCETVPSRDRLITKLDLYEDGFCGGENSAKKRLELLKFLDLPERLSSNALVEIINVFLSFEEYKKAVEELKNND